MSGSAAAAGGSRLAARGRGTGSTTKSILNGLSRTPGGGGGGGLRGGGSRRSGMRTNSGPSGGRGGGFHARDHGQNRTSGRSRGNGRNGNESGGYHHHHGGHGLKLAASDATNAALARASLQKARVPFEGTDYSSLLKEIPDQHWASPYLEEVANTLGNNPDIPPAHKLVLFTETLDVLSNKFADAEG